MKNATTTIDLSPIDRMISFLTMRYAFRYNTVLSCTEYRPVALSADSFPVQAGRYPFLSNIFQSL